MNGVSCDNLLFNLVLLRHSGVHCHLPIPGPGHSSALLWSRVPSRRSRKFASTCIFSYYFSHLHRHCFYAGETDCAHPTQMLAFNLLKFALNPEEEEEESMNIHAMSYKIRPGVPLYVEDDRLVTILAQTSRNSSNGGHTWPTSNRLRPTSVISRCCCDRLRIVSFCHSIIHASCFVGDQLLLCRRWTYLRTYGRAVRRPHVFCGVIRKTTEDDVLVCIHLMSPGVCMRSARAQLRAVCRHRRQ